jgi:LmbE family N-acetylglucosaminyl deacetylase
MNILAIGAHPDDIEIGCAGTVMKFKEKDCRFYQMVLTCGFEGGDAEMRRQEQERAAEVIGVDDLFWGGFKDTMLGADIRRLIDSIENVMKKTEPAFIFVNYPKDTHQDHRYLAEATISAARNTRNILFYEVPTSIDFNPNVFVDISQFMERKLEALIAHASQIDKTNIEGLSILDIAKAAAFFRGVQGRTKYAEGFCSLRLFINI